ncbi:hypothetical protein [Nocardia carnea]|uniref:Uncharacterized protein n=1 Tax=Nocardia carnea TaxID=37328 RepID=A0ABW7TKN0_9NOCA|nr:hypothetical protein [Nocardia carnea]
MRYFIQYSTPARAQIFSLMVDSSIGIPSPDLQLVTTLGADHLHLASKLVTRLNDYLQELALPEPDMPRETLALPSTDEFPEPVRESIRRFLERHCSTPSYGDWGWHGPIYSSLDYADRLGEPRTADELYAVMTSHGTDLVTSERPVLPLRLENYVDRDLEPQVRWSIEPRTGEPDVGYDDVDPARWAHLDGLKPQTTWTSWIVGKLDARRNPVERSLREGIELAMEATSRGRAVRIHSVTVWVVDERDSDGFPRSSHGSHGWVVEIFEDAIDDRTYTDEEEDRSTEA